VRALLAVSIALSLSSVAEARGRATLSPFSVATSAPLFFDPRLPFVRLLVRARIGDHPCVLAIDSGSPDNVIALPLAQAAHFPLGASAGSFPDYAGRRHELFPLSESGVVEGVGLPIDSLSASAWADFHDEDSPGGAHMDGILSPQKLALPGEAVVLDLQQRTISAMRWSDAEAMVDAQPLLLANTKLAGDGHFYARVRIDGEARSMVIDTGAPHSLIYAARQAGLPKGSTRQSLQRVTLAAGEVAHRMIVTELEPIEPGGQEGLLGLDVLAACVIAISRDHLLARCGQANDPSFAFVDPQHVHAQVCGADGQACVQALADGSYSYRGVRILPNGKLAAPIKSQSELRKFYDATRDLRHDLDHDYYLRESFAGLPKLLASVWNDRKLKLRERREIVFEIWDEAAEPDDENLGAEGAEARRIIDAFVRQKALRGDRYDAAELLSLNRRRARAPYFDPYRREVDDELAAR
jgi:hypothetical protein